LTAGRVGIQRGGNLYNERPAWLGLAYQKLDAAVADACGWPADHTDELV
jgi:hypothetical protein